MKMQLQPNKGAQVPLFVIKEEARLYLLGFYLVGAGIVGLWGAHDGQRMGQLLVLLCLMPFGGFADTQQVSRAEAVRIWLTVGLLFVSLMLSMNRWSLLEWGLATWLAMLYRLMPPVPLDSLYRQIRLVIRASLGLYLGVFLALYLLVLASDVPLVRFELFWGFINIRHFSHVQTVTLILTCYLWLEPAVSSRERRIDALLCSGWWTLLWWSGSRGTQAAVLCALPAMALCRAAMRPLVWRAARYALIGAIATLVLAAVVPSLLGKAADMALLDTVQRTQADPLSGRAPLWRAAWLMIREAPWTGQGPMSFATVPGMVAAHPHNIYLQLAAEWGLPALLLAVLGLGGLMGRLWRMGHAGGDPLAGNMAAITLAGLVAVCVDGLVSGNWVMPASQMAIFYLFLHAKSVVAAGPAAPGKMVRLPAGLIHGVAWLGAGACLVASALTFDVPVNPARGVQPRFWLAGPPLRAAP